MVISSEVTPERGKESEIDKAHGDTKGDMNKEESNTRFHDDEDEKECRVCRGEAEVGREVEAGEAIG